MFVPKAFGNRSAINYNIAHMQPRTRRQKEVLEIITRYIENNGHLPSYQMIAHHMGVSSKSGISRHIDALEAQGLIRRRLDDGRFKLELCGHERFEERSRIVEWYTTEHNSNGRESWENEPFSIPLFLLGIYADADVFAYRVPDGALSDKNICEGDVAIIERRTFAREGSLVFAEIKKSDSVLRGYYRSGSNIELRPANDDFEDIRVPADSVTVLGVYRSLIRPPG
jgi:SOS regulatory protein LexA